MVSVNPFRTAADRSVRQDRLATAAVARVHFMTGIGPSPGTVGSFTLRPVSFTNRIVMIQKTFVQIGLRLRESGGAAQFLTD